MSKGATEAATNILQMEEKERSRWLPCSLVLYFIENVENVKNVGCSLGGSLAHWFSVLWEMWKM